MFIKGDLRVDVFQKCTRKNAKIVGNHCSLMTYLRSSTCLSNFLSGVLTTQRLERKTALVSQQITHLWSSWPRLLHKGQCDPCYTLLSSLTRTLMAPGIPRLFHCLYPTILLSAEKIFQFSFLCLYLSPQRLCSLFSDVQYLWRWHSRNVCGPGNEVAKDQ